jgi:hypothetical protein
MTCSVKYWLICATLIASLNGCTSLPAHHEASLYDRLGGAPVITAITNDFLQQLHADPLLKYWESCLRRSTRLFKANEA